MFCSEPVFFNMTPKYDSALSELKCYKKISITFPKFPYIIFHIVFLFSPSLFNKQKKKGVVTIVLVSTTATRLDRQITEQQKVVCNR